MAKKKTKYRYVNRYKKTRRRKKDKAVPMAATAGFMATFLTHGAESIIAKIQDGFRGAETWQNVGNYAIRNLTGLNPTTGQWRWDILLGTYTPMVVGGLISKFVGGAPLNLNRKIPQVVRKYIKL